MNALKIRELISPWLASASALAFALPVQAQSDAVTQFAPLDDSPIPTAPRQPETTDTHAPALTHVEAKSSSQPSLDTPGNTASSNSVAQHAVNASTNSSASTTPAGSPPTLGSTWLGAPTSSTPQEPPPTVVESGLPVFVNPSLQHQRDVGTDKSIARAPDDKETHRVAATFSLARAFLLPAVVPGEVKNAALYEGSVEVKVFERFSLAVIGGVGGFDVPLSQFGENVHVTGKELGGVARVYVLGDFDHGLTVGGEYLRVWAEADPINVEGITPPPLPPGAPPLPPGTGVLTGEATLSGLGAFVGYKFTAGFGLTFDAKLGIQKLTADGKGTVSGDLGPQYPTLTESETFHYDQLVPLVNANIGWAI